jgi:signal transduction histidine kinase
VGPRLALARASRRCADAGAAVRGRRSLGALVLGAALGVAAALAGAAGAATAGAGASASASASASEADGATGPAWAPGSVLVIETADFCRRAGDALPGPDCEWKRVPLAHEWRGERTEPTNDGWFRLRWRLAAVPAHPLAAYIVGFNRSGRLFVNGQPLVELGPMRAPLPLNWNRAQYATIPPALLRAGDNTLEVQQRVYGWESGWLSPVRIGPEETLRPIYEGRRFWQNDLVRVFGAATFAIGLFMLGVWLGRRDQAMYLWFGLATLVWSAISLDYFALAPPLPALLWERVVILLQALRGLTMYVFILRYAGRRSPLIEGALWLYLAIGAAGIFLHWLPGVFIPAWFLVSLLVSPYFYWILVRESFRQDVAEGVMFAIAGAAQIGLSAYDLWLFAQTPWTDRIYLAHFSEALYLIVVGWGLMRRFIDSLNAHERLALVLEQRIDEKAQELGRNVEQLIEARRSEALARERTRIMSEMHDGIGSQLTMALSLARDAHGEGGRVAEVLRESIEDLQLIIDSLEPVENDLLTVLGTLRYRLLERLGKSGITLQWSVVDLPPMPTLTPHSVLSILRILQEAFANCIRHSGARTIVVSTELTGGPDADETARIRIVDDGRGFEAPPVPAPAGPAATAAPVPPAATVAAAVARRGRGLDNMRRRAAALGARLEIVSRPGRTEVMLAIPTGRHARNPESAPKT